MIVSFQLLDLDDGVDHLWGDALTAHKLIHLLLCLEFGGLELSNGVNYLFTCQFNRRAIPEFITKCLDFFLVDRALGRLHQVDLCGLLEDGLGYLEGLVEVGLDERVGQLFPVGGCKYKLLELFLIALGNGCPTPDSVICKAILCLKVCVLNHDFAGLEEVVEGHGAVLLVLGIAEHLALLDELVDDSLRGLSTLELFLLL